MTLVEEEAVNSVTIITPIPWELGKKIEQATTSLLPGYKRHLENVAMINQAKVAGRA